MALSIIGARQRAQSPAQGAAVAEVAPLEYLQQDWGDFINGTKHQLQGIGIAPGLAYPGEPGAPKRAMTVTDSRGCPMKIAPDTVAGNRFNVWRTFPGWPERPENYRGVESQPYPGVRMRPCFRSDEYLGTAEALVAAGLIPKGHFPGQPGMRKVRVTILADGTLPAGAPTSNYSRTKELGERTVERATAATFRVRVTVSEDEFERRVEAYERMNKEWEEAMAKLPRPEPLVPLYRLRPPEERHAEAEKASRSLKQMHRTERDYRAWVVDRLRSMVRFVVESESKPAEWHGYTIDPKAIVISFDALADAVMRADVAFDAKRHHEIEQGYRAIIAAGDDSFSASLARLAAPNPSLLQGEPS